jgi:hypothetical protein
MLLGAFLALLRPSRLSLCRCGHSRNAHQHYRRGLDCALCACAKYRWAPALPEP